MGETSREKEAKKVSSQYKALGSSVDQEKGFDISRVELVDSIMRGLKLREAGIFT